MSIDIQLLKDIEFHKLRNAIVDIHKRVAHARAFKQAAGRAAAKGVMAQFEIGDFVLYMYGREPIVIYI